MQNPLKHLNWFAPPENDIQVINDRPSSYNSVIILVLATTMILYAFIVLYLRLREGNLILAALMAAFILLNATTVLLVLKNKSFSIAANISVGSILLLATSVVLFANSIPIEFFITIMPIAACIAAIASLKYAIVWMLLLGLCSIGLLWLRLESQGINDFAIDSNTVMEQTTRASIFGFIVTLVAMQILRRTNETSNRNAVQLKEKAVEANKHLVEALDTNRSLLEMTYRMQRVGKTFFFVYYVQSNQFYSTSSRPKADGPKFYSLEEVARVHYERYKSHSVLIARIGEAVKDGKNWNDTFETVGIKGQTVFLNSIGEVEKEGDTITVISGVVHDITEERKLSNRLFKQATYDHLTGLLNRHSFEEQLQEVYDASNGPGKSAYLFLDLDRFKLVNDTSGHKAGDELLKKFSETLKAKTRKSDLIARLGGDEFAVLLIDCHLNEARRIAEYIRSSVENFRFEWNGSIHTIAVSIGVVEFNPELGSIDVIQNLADEACYKAKNSGRNRVEIIEGASESVTRESVEKGWVNKINQGIANNNFVLFAQEIESTGDNSQSINKLEILIRFYDDSEENKFIPPGLFLPIAERYNLMIDIDIWVFDTLEKVLREKSAMLDGSQFWINLSGDSVSDTRVADHIVTVMENSPLPKGMINFEITETSAIKNIEVCRTMMERLREYGCRFALDDFGSGHASFGYLRMLPVDVVKIDGMFIKNILDDEVNRIFTQSIIDVAHAMGMEVVAEFVECDNTRALLKSMGADYVQGFGISKPTELDFQFARIDKLQHPPKSA